MPWNQHACPGCALPSPKATLCGQCNKRPRRFDAAWAPLVYAPPIRGAITALKYRGQLQQARFLGELMYSRLRQSDQPPPDLIVPVPLHRWRLMRRGFNQSAEIAKAIKRRSGLAIDSTAARRVLQTAAQVDQQDAAARKRNVRNAFLVDRCVKGLHIALLDDVMTTGATLETLAIAVKKAGAARVSAWAVAREP